MLDPSGLGDHIDRLFRAAWAMSGSPHDAEDLVQETFARVLAKPRWLRNDDDLGYLLKVLRNTFISSRRAAARRPVASLDDSFEPVDPRAGNRPEQAVESREVFAVIAGLSEPFRDALVAVDVAGLSYAEAAKHLGIEQATISSRVYRARARVARGMKSGGEGVQPSRG